MLNVVSVDVIATVVAHTGEPLAPHDAWWAWAQDPIVTLPLAGAAVLHWRGHRPADGIARARAWWAGWFALVLALVSPVDAAATALLAAHMVQHVLLVVVAAPLIAAAAPGSALLRGLPDVAGRRIASLPRRVGIDLAATRRLRSPAARWLAFVASFWLWHSSVLYGAAIESRWVHAVEHVTFLGTAILLWSVIVGPSRVRIDRGPAVVLVFVLGLQSVLLSALVTFARTPWYDEYSASTSGWGMTALADQQLAGVIMWIPSGLITTAVALRLLLAWLRDLDGEVPRRRDGRARDSTTVDLGTSGP